MEKVDNKKKIYFLLLLFVLLSGIITVWKGSRFDRSPKKNGDHPMLLFLSLIETEEERVFCETLYLKYRTEMYYKALSYVKNQYDAEDTIQTVFCEVAAKYIGKLESLDEEARERFLLLVTKYRSLNLKKRRSRFVSLDASLSDTAFAVRDLTDDGFVEEICRKAEYAELNEAVEKLDPEDKVVLWMRFKLELSSAEIADVLGEKHQTIIKRIQRAKKKLASMLDREGGAA